MIESLKLPSDLNSLVAGLKGGAGGDDRKARLQLWLACKQRRQELKC
jgi:hypothetical protein